MLIHAILNQQQYSTIQVDNIAYTTLPSKRIYIIVHCPPPQQKTCREKYKPHDSNTPNNTTTACIITAPLPSPPECQINIFMPPQHSSTPDKLQPAITAPLPASN
jgi:hypothetical protein